MRIIPFAATVAAFLLLASEAVAVDLEEEGVIEVFPDPTTCLQGGFLLTDPCTGDGMILEEFMADLDAAAGHDLIRVDLEDVTEGPSAIDLGNVNCLGNDLSRPYMSLPINGPPDGEAPAPGAAYMYLARGNRAPAGGDAG